ncbi:condensation domain-containing protein, partial [Acidovorax facilis]
MSKNDLDSRRARLSSVQRAELQRRLSGAGSAQTSEVSIPSCRRSERIPLSYAQRSLWLTWRLDPTSPAYNMAGGLSLKGSLDTRALGDALDGLVRRHEILRTAYPAGDDGEPFQHILDAATVGLRHFDLTSVPRDAVRDEVRRLLGLFAEESFSLEEEVPFRAALYRLSDDEHFLGLSLHHIAGDGWSIGILIEELFSLYEALKTKSPPQLPPMPIQFADYAVWQREWFDAGERDRQMDYWRSRLGTEHPVIELPLKQPRGAVVQPREARHVFQLSREISDRLRDLGRSRGGSLYMVMLSLLKLTLYRFSGAHDLRVGAPVANRQKAETHGLIGYLLNLLVLRTRMHPTQSFADLLDEVRKTVLDAQAHQDLPFDLLVEALQAERAAGIHPLFQVKCTQQEDVSRTRSLADLDVGIEPISSGRVHFDLSLDFTDQETGIRCVLIYADALFDEAVIRGIATALEEFAEQVVLFPGRAIAELSLPARSSGGGSGPSCTFEANDVLQMWARAVVRNATEVAVRDEIMALSYAALDQHSDRLAQTLIERGVGCDDRVGLFAERSCEFVVGVLAVLKAGGAYVPLDPAFPAERLAYQVRDSGAVLMLSSGEQGWNPGIPVLQLDLAEPPVQVAPLPVPPTHPAQAAYVIYTSGSTGQPKGVVISRGALANYVQAVLERVDLPADASQ